MAPHVLPHSKAAGDYSLLKREGIPHVPLHNVISGGDYSVMKRDDVLNGLAAGGHYSVLKREEREVS